ncbi:MAG: DUF2752 domain-containing protein, partial [Bacteroidota bacterium]|nr:DUF2752 domain-containing protein [Bacteroidota bacterium]
VAFFSYMLPCIYHKLFGISCPLCGFQRSLEALVCGEIKKSVYLFPPIFYVFFMVIISVITYYKHKTLNTKAMKISSFILLILLALNCIYQNFVV